MSLSLSISGHTLVMESPKLRPRFKLFKAFASLNTLTLGVSSKRLLHQDVARDWETHWHFCCYTLYLMDSVGTPPTRLDPLDSTYGTYETVYHSIFATQVISLTGDALFTVVSAFSGEKPNPMCRFLVFCDSFHSFSDTFFRSCDRALTHVERPQWLKF